MRFNTNLFSFYTKLIEGHTFCLKKKLWLEKKFNKLKFTVYILVNNNQNEKHVITIKQKYSYYLHETTNKSDQAEQNLILKIV